MFGELFRAFFRRGQEVPPNLEETGKAKQEEHLFSWKEVSWEGALSKLIEGLSDEQKGAITTKERWVLVNAGPGAGKTLTLVRRVAWMVEMGIPPGEIALITFTRKAASEMRSRLNALMGGKAEAIFVGTFHSYGLHLLTLVGETATLLTEEEAMRLFGEAVGEVKGRVSQNEVLRIFSSIGRKTGYGQLLSEEESSIWQAYLRRKGDRMDFEDLLSKPLSRKEALELARPHLLVDEFQDVNWPQIRLIQATAKSLFAVGDIKQSIYSWRGADPSLMREFLKYFPDGKIYYLTLNHRSSQEIVRVANAFAEAIPGTKDIPKTQKATRGEVGWFSFRPSMSLEEDVEVAVEAVKAMMERYGPSGVAVLYRSRSARGKNLEEALSKRFYEEGVPVGDMGKLTDRLEYSVFFGLLELVLFPGNREVASRLESIKALPMEIRQSLREKASLPDRAFTAKGKAILSLYQGLQESVEDAVNLMPFLSPPSPTLIEAIALSEARKGQALAVAKTLSELYLDGLGEGVVNLLDLLDFLWERAPGVTPDGPSLLTIHAAKGLEWPAVVVVGLREGLFPANNAPLLEEYFLAYVAITRGREEVLVVGDPSSRFGAIFSAIG